MCNLYLRNEILKIQVSNPGGMDTINAAIKELMEGVSRDEWQTVAVAVAPSTVSVTFMDGRDPIECRVRFLSFLGIGQNVQQAAFIMHTAQVSCQQGYIKEAGLKKSLNAKKYLNRAKKRKSLKI